MHNQRAIADELNRQGLIRWLGHVDSVSDYDIFNALSALIDHGLDEDWSSVASLRLMDRAWIEYVPL